MLVILGSDSIKKVKSNLHCIKSGDSAPTGFSPMQVRLRVSPAVSRYSGNSVWLKNGAVWCVGVEWVVECVYGGVGGRVCVCVWHAENTAIVRNHKCKFPKQFPSQHCHYAIYCINTRCDSLTTESTAVENPSITPSTLTVHLYPSSS